MEAVLVIKNVSVKLFSFINGGSIGDEERVCQTLQLLLRVCETLQLLQWGVLVIKNVCQTLQLHQWREYW